MEIIELSNTNLSSISLPTGFKSLAQKTKKYVQKVRGIKEKGTYQAVYLRVGSGAYAMDYMDYRHMLANLSNCNQEQTLNKH